MLVAAIFAWLFKAPIVQERPMKIGDVVLKTKLMDGSIVSTIYLGLPHTGPSSPMQAFVDAMGGLDGELELGGDDYLFETAILVDGECRVLRRHRTKGQAITWHEDYLDKVIVQGPT